MATAAARMTTVDDGLRICLDARVDPERFGGVTQVIIGVASGLSSLPQTADEFTFLTFAGADDWLRPYVGGACRIERVPPTAAQGRLRRAAGAAVGRLGHGRAAAVTRVVRRGRPPLPRADAFIDEARFDVVHFLTQQGFATRLPTLYQPYDLQHLHFPEFFGKATVEYREARYRALCAQAHLVIAMTGWTQRDLVERYALAPATTRVVPLAPVLTAYRRPVEDEVAARIRGLGIEPPFAYYPAQTYPHKNHLRLLEALAMLRRGGVVVPLVCSGFRSDFAAVIDRRVSELGLDGQVHFLGYVSTAEVYSLYLATRCLVFPSLFEGWGLPVVEALATDTPVACSSASGLDEVAGDAALLFDPYDARSIADAVAKVWQDEEARSTLVERGRRHVSRLSWSRTAQTFRALYREVAGRALSRDDELLVRASRAE